MGSYEKIIKIEQIRKKMEEGDVFAAQKIVNTLDLKKIKKPLDIQLIAEVYAENEYYDEAAQLYIKLYNKSRTRKILYHLVDISIKRSNEEDAEYFLEEYQKIAPNDVDCLVFRYKIDKMKGKPYETLIESLEKLKKIEYTEKWAYELAKLYYKADMEKECINECSDIILWFGEGVYVEKAKMLRSYFSGEAGKEKLIETLKRKALYNENAKENIGESSGTNIRESTYKDSIQSALQEEPRLSKEAPLEQTSDKTDEQIEDNINMQKMNIEQAEDEVEETLYGLLREEENNQQ